MSMLTPPPRRLCAPLVASRAGFAVSVTRTSYSSATSDSRLPAIIAVTTRLSADEEPKTQPVPFPTGGGEATAAEIDVTGEAEWAGLIAKTVATWPARHSG
jgi:hypothetical protein